MNKLTSLLAAGKKYVQLHSAQHGTRIVVALLLIFALFMFVAGRWSSPVPDLVSETIAGLKSEMMQQQIQLEQIARDQVINVDALAIRLAELKAASTRLDALGERLVKLGQLEPEEFDFSQPPPLGGQEITISSDPTDIVDLSQAIRRLAKVLSLQRIRLDALQLLLLDRNLEAERMPAGWPVGSGWISSGFGERNDPFTGKRTQHEGLDFAASKGTDVIGVARGVVIWAGPKQGYGQTLEIEHGNGYVTRYAHNEELLVKAGDRVTAGQTVATMGATGRASSPHLHFEVLYEGKAVNPSRFVSQMR